MMKLDTKIAMITGAASGIGEATGRLFADEGAAVLIVDQNSQAGERVTREIVDRGGRAVFIRADVSSGADMRASMERAEELFGGLDVLVNNAAVQLLAKLTETSEEDWDRVQNVNLKGVFLGCKYAIPLMVKRGGGSIINVASVLGFVGDPDLAAYCAAKGGVIALTKVAALTYGPDKVRVNCVCPGDVETPLVTAYFGQSPDPAAQRRMIAEKYALRRIADPGEVARLIVFLASQESSFMTGASVVIDGGLTIKCY